MADYGHVTCDEISLILELGSNLIYYFGTNDGLSFLWHMVHHECIYEA